MNIASKIDHTMLKADSKKETILRYCQEAKEYGFASVCVNSVYVPLVHKALTGSCVKTCCVVGFPLGAMSMKAKAFEAETAVSEGADEIDMVINVGALKDGDDETVLKDIEAVCKVTQGKILKVIIETCLLSNDEIIRACKLSEKAGADFVKTSTGFSTGGAKIEDVSLMRKSVSEKVKVKASGGIRTPEDAKAMIEAGAERIGAGNGVILI